MFMVYCSLIALPNCLIVAIYPDRANIEKLVLSLCSIAAWHLAFRRPRVAIAGMLPFFLLLPMIVAFIATYHEPPTTNALYIISETTALESFDYMRSRFLPVAGGLLLSCAVWAVMFRTCGSSWRFLAMRRAGRAPG
jgi:hypothetical protein